VDRELTRGTIELIPQNYSAYHIVSIGNILLLKKYLAANDKVVALKEDGRQKKFDPALGGRRCEHEKI